MSSFNRVILMGNLTRDPELRQTQSGTSICRFSVAVNRSFSAQDGTTRDETCFVDVDSFGRTAENISKYFSRGKPILVEGRLRQDSWEDKQGQKRTKLVVVLERFEFIGSKGDSSMGGGFDSDYAPSPARARTQASAPQDDLEDDVPF